MAENKGVVVLMLVVLSGLFGISYSKTVVVGGSAGWTIPTSASLYSSWASQNKLQVGDVLVFKFPAGVHTVAEVSKANYDSCTSASTLGPVMTTAPANITLTKPGTHYFICTITGHCSANQKLTVSVSAASLASSPKSSPAPTPSTSPVATPMPTPTPSPMAPTPTPTPAPMPETPAPVSPPMVGPGPATVPEAASTPEGEPGAASPTEGEPGAASPPAGNVAAPTGVSLLSFLCIVAMGLML